jgi:drug/metabolite transporter (DMT)-like permease
MALLNALCYPLIAIRLSYAPLLLFAAIRALIAGLALALCSDAAAPSLAPQNANVGRVGGHRAYDDKLGYLGMFHAAEFISPGLATVVGNSQPVVAALLAHSVVRERLDRLQSVGLLLGFAGVVAVSLPQLTGAGGASFATGLGYIILAAGGLGVGNVLMKAVADQVDSLVAMAAQLLFGALPLGLVAILRERPSVIMWTPGFVPSLLGLALPGTALAYWLWFATLERVLLSRANAFTFLTPFIGLFLGVAFFGSVLA